MKFIFFLLIHFALYTAASGADLKVIYKFSGKAPKGAILYFTQSTGNKDSAQLNQIDKKFTPLFFTIAQNQTLSISNEDDVDHNVYVNNEKQGIQFDIGLKKPGKTSHIKANWPKNQLIRLNCNIHAKMRSWVAVVDSKYTLVSTFDKKNKDKQKGYYFSLQGIPDKYKKIRVLIPSYETVNLTFTKKQTYKIPLIKRGKQKGKMIITLSK